jgi:L-glyceraldehyde 3-phosphate reductase
LALAWVLRHPNMTSALIGSRTVKQLDQCLDSLKNLKFTTEEIKTINQYAKEEEINLWSGSSKH